ncbi:AsmA family protein [Parasutterella secunda]|uniref:AsmA family protein n=1 Tax=Parasutterella secunda TaxID=626947 RepID=A0ABS2GQ15_9BURK|nr:AsmA family protein [Parasutterella secunda]MBM6927928.1 AsmA family protein [Parasutterella secunda]
MFRKVAIAIVAVVVIAFGALWAAVTYFLDSATIAEQLKKEVTTRFNRTLVFQGDLKTNFFPKVQIVLPATSLSFEGSDKPQFTLQGAQIGVAVMPLLKGDVQFDDVVIDGLKGQINAARILQKAQQSPKAQTAAGSSVETKADNSGSSFIKNLEVASVEIKNAGLTVYGLQDKKIYAVDSLNLSTGKVGLSGTTPLKFSTNFSEKTQRLSGQLSLDSTITYDVRTISVSLAKPSLAVSIQQNGETTSAELKADQLQYVNQDVSAKVLDLTANVAGMSVKAQVAAAQTQGMQSWGIDGLKLDATDNKGLKANLTGSFKGELKNLTLQSQALKGEVQTVLAQSTLSVPFEGTVSVQPGEKANLNLKGTLDKSPWQANVQVSGFTVPTINGNFALETFVVDKWIASEAAPSKKTALNSLQLISDAYAAPSQSLDVLNKANGRFGIQVNSVRYQGLNVSGVDTTITLSKGVLTLGNVKASTCSGAITGSAQVNASEKWSVNMNVKGLSMQELLKGLGSQVDFAGKANATVKLNGLGLEKTALLKSANGNMSLSINDAVLKGLSLEKVATAVKQKKVTGLVMHPEDQTRFSVLSATATVGNGILNARSIQGRASVAEVNGQVQVGMIDSSLYGEVSAKLATSVDGRRVTVPIKLGGTIQAPTYGINLEAVIKDQLHNAIEKAVTENPKLKEGQKRLIEGLGKLFNR